MHRPPPDLSYAVGGILGLLEGQRSDVQEADRIATALNARIAAATTVLERIIRNPFMRDTMEGVMRRHGGTPTATAAPTPRRAYHPEGLDPRPALEEHMAEMLANGAFESRSVSPLVFHSEDETAAEGPESAETETDTSHRQPSRSASLPTPTPLQERWGALRQRRTAPPPHGAALLEVSPSPHATAPTDFSTDASEADKMVASLPLSISVSPMSQSASTRRAMPAPVPSPVVTPPPPPLQGSVGGGGAAAHRGPLLWSRTEGMQVVPGALRVIRPAVEDAEITFADEFQPAVEAEEWVDPRCSSQQVSFDFSHQGGEPQHPQHPEHPQHHQGRRTPEDHPGSSLEETMPAEVGGGVGGAGGSPKARPPPLPPVLAEVRGSESPSPPPPEGDAAHPRSPAPLTMAMSDPDGMERVLSHFGRPRAGSGTADAPPRSTSPGREKEGGGSGGGGGGDEGPGGILRRHRDEPGHFLGLSAKSVFSETDDGLAPTPRPEDARRKRASVHFESPATPSTPATPGIFQSPGSRARRNSLKPARFGSSGVLGESSAFESLSRSGGGGGGGGGVGGSAAGGGGGGVIGPSFAPPLHRGRRDSLPTDLMMALASIATTSGSPSSHAAEYRKRHAKALLKLERRETDYRSVLSAEESLESATRFRPIAKELRLLLAQGTHREGIASEEARRRRLRKLEQARGLEQTRKLEEALLHRYHLEKDEARDRELIMQNHLSLFGYAKEVKYTVTERGSVGFSETGSREGDLGPFGLPRKKGRGRIGCLAAEGRKLIDLHSSGGGSSKSATPRVHPFAPAADPSQLVLAGGSAAGGAGSDECDISEDQSAPDSMPAHSIGRFYLTPPLDLDGLVSERLASKVWKKKKDKSRDPPKVFYVNINTKERVWDLEKALLAKEQAEYREKLCAPHIHPAHCQRCSLHFAGIPNRWRCGKCGDDLAESTSRKSVKARFCSACRKDISKTNPESTIVCRVCGRVTCPSCSAMKLPLTGLGYSGKTLLPVCTTCLAC